MAIVSLKEFAELMGMPYNTAKINSQRGNIIKGTDGKIDTENAVNRLFFDKQKAKISTKPDKKVSEKAEPTTKKRVERPTGLTANQKQYVDIDLRTKIATAEAKEREAELKRIQLEKMAGNLLPVDLVEKIVIINIHAILKGFRSERENMTSILIERFGGNRRDLVEINAMLDKSMDVVIKKAEKQANHELEQAISVYQDSKGKG